ncbi:MAG TPA: hypothetical protein PLJ49_10440, partial [Smithella sp.]|nr:hypothetical protein [Smithella sp.]
MGYLTYFPDDERFIYYGDRPSVFQGLASFGNETAFGNKMIELERQGRGSRGSSLCLALVRSERMLM